MHAAFCASAGHKVAHPDLFPQLNPAWSLETHCRDLCEDTTELVSNMGSVGAGGSSYCINFVRLIEIIRIKLVEAGIRSALHPTVQNWLSKVQR